MADDNSFVKTANKEVKKKVSQLRKVDVDCAKLFAEGDLLVCHFWHTFAQNGVARLVLNCKLRCFFLDRTLGCRCICFIIHLNRICDFFIRLILFKLIHMALRNISFQVAHPIIPFSIL